MAFVIPDRVYGNRATSFPPFLPSDSPPDMLYALIGGEFECACGARVFSPRGTASARLDGAPHYEVVLQHGDNREAVREFDPILTRRSIAAMQSWVDELHAYSQRARHG